MSKKPTVEAAFEHGGTHRAYMIPVTARPFPKGPVHRNSSLAFTCTFVSLGYLAVAQLARRARARPRSETYVAVEIVEGVETNPLSLGWRILSQGFTPLCWEFVWVGGKDKERYQNR